MAGKLVPAVDGIPQSPPRGPVHRVPECPLDLGVTSSRASHLEEGEPGRAYPFYGLASEVCGIHSTL